MHRLRLIVAALAACFVLVALGIYARSEMVLRRQFPLRRVAMRAATDPLRVARGQHLMATSCAGCHGADYGGRPFLDGMPFARIAAPNLTSGPGGAARLFSDADFEGAIRHGVLPDGRSLLIMPSEIFASIADDDLAAILGALRAAPPVDRQMPLPAFGPVGRTLVALGVAKLQSAQLAAGEEPAPATAPPVASSVEYGRYLTHIDGCVRCHGAGLSGGLIPDMGPDKKIAANLTPAGLGAYSEPTFIRAMRHGIRPDGTPIDSFMPWRTFTAMTDTDLGALYAYLHTVPARPFGQR